MNEQIKLGIAGGIIGFIIDIFLFSPYNVFEASFVGFFIRGGCIAIIIFCASIGFLIGEE